MGHLLNYGIQTPGAPSPPGNQGAPSGVGGKGLFGATPVRPVAVARPTFMVVSANSTDPTIASAPGAAWRDGSGVWHVINTSALGARGSFGVTHANGVWYLTTNAPGGIHSLLGQTPDGTPPAAFTVTDTGLTEPLTAIDASLGFKIGSLLGNIITAPTNLSSFTSNSAGGPFGYVVLGVASNQDHVP